MVKSSKRPAAVSAAPNAKVARKSNSSDVASSKTTSVKSKSTDKSEPSVVDQIRALEAQVYESKKNYNNIASIFTYCAHDKHSPQDVLAASQALRRIFLSLMKSKECALHQSHTVKATEALSKVESWLRSQAWKYIQFLLKTIALSDDDEIPDALVVASIDVLMELAVQDAQAEFNLLHTIDNSAILIQVRILLLCS
jgi:hypothetical protein